MKTTKQPKQTIKREAGFYWIKYGGVWTVARWLENAGCWQVCGLLNGVTDNKIEQISEERVEKPENL